MILAGMVATADGLGQTSTVTLSPSGRGATECRQLYNAPALEYRQSQPVSIPVDFDHTGSPVGEVAYLALRGHGLFGVLEVDDDVADELPSPFFLSAELDGHYERAVYSDIVLRSVGICARSATVAKQPAVVVRGDSLELAAASWGNPMRGLLGEAHRYCLERRYRSPQPHRIGGASTVERVDGDVALVDGERPVHRRSSGRNVWLPGGGGFAELEYSAHAGRIISVR